MLEGSDSDNGPWEYTVLDGPSKRVLASGKVDSTLDVNHLRHYRSLMRPAAQILISVESLSQNFRDSMLQRSRNAQGQTQKLDCHDEN